MVQRRRNWTTCFVSQTPLHQLLLPLPLVRPFHAFKFVKLNSPLSALLRSSQVSYLSPYEKSEILDFHKIYYIGTRSEKTQATPDANANNFGYDDERGDYIVVTGDHLAYRYEIMDVLGTGSFGQVLQCRDHATGESVAVKIIRNTKRFHHQALVEIKILENLKKWVCLRRMSALL